MMELTSVHKEVLLECSEDDVGLWSILRKARLSYGPTVNPTALIVRQDTLQIIRDLLESGLIEAGHPVLTKGKPPIVWRPLPLPLQGIVDFIDSEWDELGRDPNIGDIVWFRATPIGQDYVRSHLGK